MRIALAQINPTVGDIALNSEKIVRFAREAKAQGARVVVFPELSVTGYPPKDLLLKPRFVEDNIRAVHRIAGQIDPDLEADREEQDHDAELGEDRGGLGELRPAQGVRADDDAAEQLADDGGLAEPARELLPDLRGHEQHEEAEEDVGRRTRGGLLDGRRCRDATDGEREGHQLTTTRVCSARRCA